MIDVIISWAFAAIGPWRSQQFVQSFVVGNEESVFSGWARDNVALLYPLAFGMELVIATCLQKYFLRWPRFSQSDIVARRIVTTHGNKAVVVTCIYFVLLIGFGVIFHAGTVGAAFDSYIINVPPIVATVVTTDYTFELFYRPGGVRFVRFIHHVATITACAFFINGTSFIPGMPSSTYGVWLAAQVFFVSVVHTQFTAMVAYRIDDDHRRVQRLLALAIGNEIGCKSALIMLLLLLYIVHFSMMILFQKVFIPVASLILIPAQLYATKVLIIVLRKERGKWPCPCPPTSRSSTSSSD